MKKEETGQSAGLKPLYIIPRTPFCRFSLRLLHPPGEPWAIIRRDEDG